MSFFDRFKDRPDPGSSADDQAIARYRYLVRTAPPEAIEEAHAEAFARLSPEQRRRLLEEMAGDMPPAERNAAVGSGFAPATLARVATRAEVREPGAVERAWNRLGNATPAAPGMGFGGMFATSLFGSLAGSVIGTAIAQHFFANSPAAASLFGGGAEAASHSETAGSLTDDPWAGLDKPAADDGDFADLDGDLGGDTFDI